MQVYLAGPEVFLPNAQEILAAKCDLCRAAGLTPLAPGDANAPKDLSPFDTGLFINRVDEDLMTRADAAIINLTPFRGVSADVGSAYEAGFMASAGKPVFGYTNDPRPYGNRVSDAYLAMPMPDGVTRDSSGFMVENFDMIDNLMVHAGIHQRGHPVVVHHGGGEIANLEGFKTVLSIAAKALLDQS